MREISLGRDPMAEPVFEIGPLDHHALSISEKLAAAIDDWDARYKAFFDLRDVSFTHLYSNAADLSHNEEGRRLARALQAELGEGFVVEYRG